MLRGSLITACGTLFSRCLGMLRDAATAALFGMSATGVMDAFVFAFRLPDIARRMFGEGSLSISFIPVFAKLWAEDRKKAWKLLSVVLFWVFTLLTGFVLLGEALCWMSLRLFEPTSKVYLAAHLMSLMLPYLILICMAAIGTAALQTAGHFLTGSLIPIILNVIWLFGVLLLAPLLTDNPADRCYILAVCVLLAGIVQFLIQLPVLRRFGGRFDLDFRAVRDEIRVIRRNALPTMIGLMTIQLNILIGSCVAWAFSGPAATPIRWLGRMIEYPLQAGSVSAVYYSERLFEFPQGMIGLAMATAIYPLISRHAARKDYTALSDDLGLAARIIFALGIPAGVGLMLFSERLAHLLYQRGAFTPLDTARTADMIFYFGTGVWAFCLIPLMVRGFYAIGDIRTPLRIGLGCSLVNLLLCLALIWLFREQGVALATSLSATLQTVLLFYWFSRKHGHLKFRWMATCVLRSMAASCVMAGSIYIVMKAIPGNDSFSDLLHIVAAGTVGFVVYLLSYRILGGRELSILLRGRERERSGAIHDRPPRRRKKRRR